MSLYYGSPCVTQGSATNAQDQHTLATSNVYRPSSSRGRSLTENMNSKPQLGCRAKSDYTGSRSTGSDELPLSSSYALVRPASQDHTSGSETSQWHENRPESLARSWLAKSSMLLRRKNNKPSSKTLQTFTWLEDTDLGNNGRNVQELSKRRRSKHSREQSMVYGMFLVTKAAVD